MTNPEKIATRISAILDELAAMSSTSAGGGVNYNIAGQSVDHVGYRMSLLAELKQLQELQAATSGPFEFASEGWTG